MARKEFYKCAESVQIPEEIKKKMQDPWEEEELCFFVVFKPQPLRVKPVFQLFCVPVHYQKECSSSRAIG